MNDFTTTTIEDVASLGISQGSRSNSAPYNLPRVWNAAREALNQAGLEETPMFIAGGSVRDLIYGFAARDYDVFFQGPKDSDEMEDLLVFVTSVISEEIGDEVQPSYGGRVSGGTYNHLSESSSFIPYRLSPFHGIMPGGRRFHAAIDVMGEFNSVKDAAELVNRFDHDLVRCAYDGKNVLIDPRFMAAAKKGRVECATDSVNRRLNMWRDRTGVKGLVIGRPPKVKAPTTLTSGQYISYRDAMSQNSLRSLNINAARELLWANGVRTERGSL